jgi:hypothetical protein
VYSIGVFVLGIVVGGISVGYVRSIPEQIVAASVPATPTSVAQPEALRSTSAGVPLLSDGSSRPDQLATANDVVAPRDETGGRPVPPAPEPEPPRQQPQPYRGSLVVTSIPEGATVFINGLPAGTTPVALMDLPVGSRAVRLTMEGYDAWSRAVQVVVNRRTEVNAVLNSPSQLVALPHTEP